MGLMGYNILKYVCRKPGKDNLFRCTYVLPDGVTHMKGFVKDPNQAERYLNLDGGAPPSATVIKEGMDQTEVTENPEDRRRIDLTKTVRLNFTLETTPFSNCITFLIFTFCSGV